MSVQEFIKEILLASVEDYYGLWEITWMAKDSFPEADENEILALSRSYVSKLAENNYISLYSRNSMGGPVIPVPAKDVEARINTDKYWKEPESEEDQLLIAATEKGESAYYNAEVPDLD